MLNQVNVKTTKIQKSQTTNTKHNTPEEKHSDNCFSEGAGDT